MTTLKNLEQKYKELGEEIEKLRQKKEQGELPDILWFPENPIEGYMLDGTGVERTNCLARRRRSSMRYTRQQLFKTREEAERADRQRIAKMKVLRRVAELNHEQGWVCDWSSIDTRKYFPQYSHNDREVSLDSWQKIQVSPTTHCASKSVWEQVIGEMEADVKFGLWGVE